MANATTNPAITTTDTDEELRRTYARMALLFKDLYTQDDCDEPVLTGIRRRRRFEHDTVEAIKDDETGDVIFFDRKLRKLKNH